MNKTLSWLAFIFSVLALGAAGTLLVLDMTEKEDDTANTALVTNNAVNVPENNSANTASNNASNSTTVNETGSASDTKTFSDSKMGFAFEYPSDWSLEVSPTCFGDPTNWVLVKSPDGHTLSISAAKKGSAERVCVPEPGLNTLTDRQSITIAGKTAGVYDVTEQLDGKWDATIYSSTDKKYGMPLDLGTYQFFATLGGSQKPTDSLYTQVETVLESFRLL